MKILLQSFETGLYLDTSGAWTNTPALAQNFPNYAASNGVSKSTDASPAPSVVVLPESAPSASPPARGTGQGLTPGRYLRA